MSQVETLRKTVLGIQHLMLMHSSNLFMQKVKKVTQMVWEKAENTEPTNLKKRVLTSTQLLSVALKTKDRRDTKSNA